MAKRIALVLAFLLCMTAMPAPAQAQGIAGWLLRQGLKQGGKALGKATGKKIVNRGAETKCLFGPFVCAKVANAPAPPARRR